MDIAQIKKTAAHLAKRCYNDEQYEIENTSITSSASEWYLIVMLANIYYNVFAGLYTRAQAVQKQKEQFELVRNNPQMFE